MPLTFKPGPVELAMSVNERSSKDSSGFGDAIDKAFSALEPMRVRGRVAEATGGVIKATGLDTAVGETCELRDRHGRALGVAEVIGFSGAWTYLSPLGKLVGLSPKVEVVPLGTVHRIPVGAALQGRVLDGYGSPIDNLGPLRADAMATVDADAPDPLERPAVRRPFVTGVRVLDGLLTCGVGQRMGVFAPPGVGKSTLLASLATQAGVDTVVVALVGERGREVGDFVRTVLRHDASKRTVVVAATSDRPAMERVKAAHVATAIAEHFRDRGQHVLLLVDSLTRLARAQREIGLSMGEPPTRRGFPSSVFSMLPKLLERAGEAKRGAITAFYSVLVDGEEMEDPVAEEVKAIVDGHVSLTRALAAAGHFPAVDVLESASRVMDSIIEPQHRDLAMDARRLMARFREIEMLVQIGEYKSGADAFADRAIAARPALQDFLRQPTAEGSASLVSTIAKLTKALQP
jgi:ATP synthase in type III secretion protein N